MGIVRGENAAIVINDKLHSVFAISDFSINFNRGVVEQELVGQVGNYYDYGALSCDGSYTNCRFAASGNSDALESIISSQYITVSGSTGSSTLKWYLRSCQVTSYEVTMGDADTISEASVGFVHMYPYTITIVNGAIKDTDY